MKTWKRFVAFAFLAGLTGLSFLGANPDINLRLLEGIREGTAAGPTAVTSSYEKLDMWGTLPPDYSLDLEIAKIKKIFNMKDVKLITEANLKWPSRGDKIFHIIRFEGREFLVLVTPAGSGPSSKFRVEVFEQRDKDKSQASLLDTEFQLPANETVYLGFEDARNDAYFLYLTWPTPGVEGGIEGGVEGGVMGEVQGGVLGGVQGGVEGGVSGGVEGGVEGGVQGGVEGRVEAGITGSEGIAMPKLVKMVQPVYLEIARQARVEGNVLLAITIDEKGRVASWEVLPGSVPLLEQSAVDAVKQWVYEPLMVNGKAKRVKATVTVAFKLNVKKKKVAGESGVEGGVAGGIVGPKDIGTPKLIKMVQPIYPEIARTAQVEGSITLSATIDTQGRVVGVKVLRSIPLLDQAAVDAVKQWVYEPMKVKGQAKPVVFTVTVAFKLDEKKKLAEGGAAVDAVRATGDIQPPKLIKMVNPKYPEIAQKASVEGVVIIEATTDKSGRVIETKILRSIPLLDQAAVDAVKQWVYEPIQVKGKPIGIIFTVTVAFRLKEKKDSEVLSVSVMDEEFAKGAVKVEGEIKPPKLTKEVAPVYPLKAKQGQVEGVVILAVRIDASGQVNAVKVLRSIPVLDQAAIDAVKQWVYEPLAVKGKPVEAVFTVTVRFVMKKTGDKEAAQEK